MSLEAIGLYFILFFYCEKMYSIYRNQFLLLKKRVCPNVNGL